MLGELTPSYDGQMAQICRTLSLGPASEVVKEKYAMLVEGMQKGIEQAKPGNRMSQVCNAINAVLEAQGYGEYCHPPHINRRGHGLGFGNGLPGEGSITAFYTVLTEGDDPQDPIADAARGILDGHIVLSRELAEAGHYPAIDIERSISRVMTSVAPQNQVDSARRFRQLLAKYNKARDLIQLGAYAPGADPELDLAVRLHADMTRLLQQDMHSPALLHASVSQLQAVVQGA